MRKEKKIFLLGIILILGLLASGCQISASEGVVTPQPNDQLDDILDAVASQTPAGSADEGVGGGEEQSGDGIIVEPDAPDPTATPTTVPSPTPTKPPIDVDKTVPSQYTLKKGEFPWCIARRFNVDPVSLLNANGIPAGQTQFSAGLVLTIPQNAGSYGPNRALTSHPTTYTVKTGDTFYSIACVYGDVWPEEIADYNDMSMGDALPAGTTLDIP